MTSPSDSSGAGSLPRTEPQDASVAGSLGALANRGWHLL